MKIKFTIALSAAAVMLLSTQVSASPYVDAGSIINTSLSAPIEDYSITDDTAIPSDTVTEITNGQTVTVEAGKTLTINGTLKIDAGGKLILNGNLTVLSGGTFNISGGSLTSSSSSVIANGGTFTVGGSINSKGTIKQTAGNITVLKTASADVGRIILSGGTTRIYGTVQSSTITCAAQLIVETGGKLTASSSLTQTSSIITVNDGGILDSTGTASFSRGTLNIYGTYNHTGGKSITFAQTVNVFGTANIYGPCVQKSGMFIVKKGGIFNAFSTLSFIGGDFRVSGTLNAKGTVYQKKLLKIYNGGKAVISNAFIQTAGTTTVKSGATVSMSNTVTLSGGTLDVYGNLKHTGTSAFTLATSVNVYGNLTTTGKCTQTNGMVIVKKGGVVNANGTLRLTSGDFRISGTLYCRGKVTVNSLLKIYKGGTANISSAFNQYKSTVTVKTGGKLNTSSTVSLSGGVFDVYGKYSHNGALTLAVDNTFTVYDGGTVTTNGKFVQSAGLLIVKKGAYFISNNSLTLTDADFRISGTMTSNGTMTVASKLKTYVGGTLNSNGSFIHNGGQVIVKAGSVFNAKNVSLINADFRISGNMKVTKTLKSTASLKLYNGGVLTVYGTFNATGGEVYLKSGSTLYTKGKTSLSLPKVYVYGYWKNFSTGAVSSSKTITIYGGGKIYQCGTLNKTTGTLNISKNSVYSLNGTLTIAKNAKINTGGTLTIASKKVLKLSGILNVKSTGKAIGAGKVKVVNNFTSLKCTGKFTVGVDAPAPITKNGLTYVGGVLVANKEFSLTKNYNPGVDPNALNAYNMLVRAGAKKGYTVSILSSFRSYTYQITVYAYWCSIYGEKYASMISAKPGTSEHQTGLAFDVTNLEESFGQTAQGKWLAANCYKYGFIIRYPKDKVSITKYNYEPWHMRYLGTDLANIVYQSGLCLEEFLEID